MTTPSPFQTAQAISNNVGGAFKDARDTSALDQILRQASETDNEQELNNTIGQILTQVSPERQGLALQHIQGRISDMRKERQFNRQSQEKERLENIKQSNKQKPQNAFEKEAQKGAAKELNEIPSKINTYTDLIDDLKKMRDLTQSTGTVFPSVLAPQKSNQYRALQNKVTLNRSALQKGAQSDKDMALLLGETGSIGDVGGVKVFDNLIKRAEENLSRTNQRAKELYETHKDQGAALPKQVNIQPTVQESQNNIFKEHKSAEFYKPDGSKLDVKKGDNQQIISALSQGYAPKGYVAMLAPDGLPDMVPVDEVENEMAKGSIVIYGQ